MFDIGWQELFLIAVVALIVIGPKDLPRVMRTVMAGIRKAREMARDLQDGLEEVAREAELDDLKKEMEKTGDVAKQIESVVDPGSLAADLDLDKDVRRQMNDAADTLKSTTDPDAMTGTAKPASAGGAGDSNAAPIEPTDPARKASG